MLSTSITFYLFVFTANIVNFPNTLLLAWGKFQLLLLLVFDGVLDATLELNPRKGKMFLGLIFCDTKNQLCHKNTSCPFSEIRPMFVLQAHRFGKLGQLQNLLVFFDALSPILGGAALSVCVIILLCNCFLVQLFFCAIVVLRF